MKRVLCVGNRYLYPDSAALDVYDEAREQGKNFVEWVEGGLGGLNLLPHFENVKDILILDYMPETQNTKIYALSEVLKNVYYDTYHHESALYYLLKSLDTLLERVPNVEVMACVPQNENFIDEVFESVLKWSKDV
ncbi:MAG: hypothetical protein Q9M32_07105 [Sulfurimonas sp.]|nr:hypothetical protein [Sulfurimonas sp.]MDQ7061402.1 hypothetical protein [Sulfurimonas sp.]